MGAEVIGYDELKKRRLLAAMDHCPDCLPSAFVRLIKDISETFGLSEEEIERALAACDDRKFVVRRRIREGACPHEDQRRYLRALASYIRAKSSQAPSS